MNTQLRTCFIFCFIVAVLLGAMGCTLLETNRTIAASDILNPPPTVVPVDKSLTITSSHSNPNGIGKVEFYVDGILINTTVPSFPQTHFIVDHTWSPPGEKKYQLTFVAYDVAGNEIDRRELELEAKANLVLVATQMAATPTRATTPIPQLPTTVACGNSALLVQETLPAGTTVQPSQTFTKSWTIRNNGTCPWTGYYFDLVRGERLGGTRVALPTVPPNTDVPVLLNLVSLANGGLYRGEWQVHNAQGQAFPQTFVVQINVPGACANPVISRFEATSLVIGRGQSATLSWEVSGATSLALEPGPQLSGTTGAVTVNPNQTTTYTLRAANGGCVSTRQLTIEVIAPTGVPTAPAALNIDTTKTTTSSLTLTWNDTSNNETLFRLYLQGSNQLIASFPANTTQGVVINLVCNRAYQFYLRAVNTQGESGNSNIVTGTTSACP